MDKKENLLKHLQDAKSLGEIGQSMKAGNFKVSTQKQWHYLMGHTLAIVGTLAETRLTEMIKQLDLQEQQPQKQDAPAVWQ